jgi:hypothetical protein
MMVVCCGRQPAKSLRMVPLRLGDIDGQTRANWSGGRNQQISPGWDGGWLIQEPNESNEQSWTYQPTDLGMIGSYHKLMVPCWWSCYFLMAILGDRWSNIPTMERKIENKHGPWIDKQYDFKLVDQSQHCIDQCQHLCWIRFSPPL